ncbi:Oxidoreductase, molybdopterin-binding domain-containing protein [Entophlyctis helioformis]|nr:Oxidoreductase, molybdopterin-binding domain-containing protein [Entophlyctis helioformis]
MPPVPSLSLSALAPALRPLRPLQALSVSASACVSASRRGLRSLPPASLSLSSSHTLPATRLAPSLRLFSSSSSSSSRPSPTNNSSNSTSAKASPSLAASSSALWAGAAAIAAVCAYLATSTARSVHSEESVALRRNAGRDASSSPSNAAAVSRAMAAHDGAVVVAAKAGSDTKPAARPLSKNGLPLYSRGEVSEHTSKLTGIWVTYADGVYDISSFVDIHPGGERILLAAGQAIDPFWAVFSIHATPETRQLLEDKGIEKLFANEPVRHKSLRVRSARPCNAEAAPESLVPFVTPNDLFFVRNHLPVPVIDPATYSLEIDGPGIPDGFSLSLDDLKTKFPRVDVMVTLQCAGNRRKEMHDVKPVKGLQWESGAISNAVWTGVRLRDVLAASGYAVPDLASTDPLPGNIAHVHFGGAEGYGASIPVEKALDPRGDVVLAFEMNGEPVPRDHGFPVRAVVPGHVAARSVKWVNRISLSDEESQSHWQQHDYKGFSPSATLETSDYSKAQSIQELPVQSAIVTPSPGAVVASDDQGFVTVKGYAVAGGGRGINRVDVSADGGKTWTDAELVTKPDGPYGRQWAWTQWEARVPVPATSASAASGDAAKDGVPVTLVCKAVDSSYNAQPEGFEGIYNVRGVLVDAWQRVNVRVAPPSAPPSPSPAPASSAHTAKSAGDRPVR